MAAYNYGKGNQSEVLKRHSRSGAAASLMSAVAPNETDGRIQYMLYSQGFSLSGVKGS